MARLTNCPDTGRNLDTVDIAKHCLTLWPSIDPQNVPNNEAGKRFTALMEEHARRKKEAKQSASA